MTNCYSSVKLESWTTVVYLWLIQFYLDFQDARKAQLENHEPEDEEEDLDLLKDMQDSGQFAFDLPVCISLRFSYLAPCCTVVAVCQLHCSSSGLTTWLLFLSVIFKLLPTGDDKEKGSGSEAENSGSDSEREEEIPEQKPEENAEEQGKEKRKRTTSGSGSESGGERTREMRDEEEIFGSDDDSEDNEEENKTSARSSAAEGSGSEDEGANRGGSRSRSASPAHSDRSSDHSETRAQSGSGSERGSDSSDASDSEWDLWSGQQGDGHLSYLYVHLQTIGHWP